MLRGLRHAATPIRVDESCQKPGSLRNDCLLRAAGAMWAMPWHKTGSCAAHGEQVALEHRIEGGGCLGRDEPAALDLCLDGSEGRSLRTTTSSDAAQDYLPLASIVINNFNYARYLPQCIESALAQTYPRTEVVVVDDASTDLSADIIRSFGDNVVAVLQPQNAGQAAAMNAGFVRSRGDVVIFLDADDYLYPGAVETVVRSFDASVAIVQYRLHLVDAEGHELDLYPPSEIRFDTGDVTAKMVRSGRFEGTVTSGLAFGRAALQAIMPIPVQRYRIAADGYLVTTVPFQGEVRAVEQPLGAYRKHGSSLWSTTMNAAAGFRRSILHDDEKAVDLKNSAAKRSGIHVEYDPWLRDYQHLSVRIGSLILDRAQHPKKSDSRLGLGLRGALASMQSTLPWRARLALSTWFAALGILPERASLAIFKWRTEPQSRPRVLRAIVRAIRTGR